jgi:hypothetical protein
METIEQLSAAQADEARLAAAALEKFYKQDVADALKARWIAWHDLAPAAKRAGIRIPPILADDNKRMDRATRQFAELVKGLDTQKFLLVQTRLEDREGSVNTLGIIHRDLAKKAGLLGAFQFLPALWLGLKIAGGIAAFLAAIKAGHLTTQILEAWNAPEKLAAEAKLLHEQNVAAAAKAIEDPQISPEVKAAYLNMLTVTANKIANTSGPGFLQSVLGAGTAGAGGLAAGVVLALALSRRR